MNAQETPDAVREAIIAAITKADANFGYSYCLTKMDEAGEEHTLFMDGFEPAVFQDREDGYPVIEQRRNAARTDAILAALDSRAGDAGEAISALRALLVIAGTPITERQEAIFRRANAIAFPTPAPAVDADEGYNPEAKPDRVNITPEHNEALHGALLASSAAVDAVPAGEVVERLKETAEDLRKIGWHKDRQNVLDAIASLSHGEGRK